VLPFLVTVALSAAPTYDDSRLALERQRLELAALRKTDVKAARAGAREALLRWLDAAAFPAWAGTPWAYFGTTTTPNEGAIACGYYVTTLLEHASVKLERVVLAQQASAWLVTSLARGSAVEWVRLEPPADVIASVRAHLPKARLLAVGLDAHAGLLRVEGDVVRFCHSSVLPPATVVCEDPLVAPAFLSQVYVFADVLNDALLDDWLLGRDVPSVLPKRPRRS
jgi:hypothetical protein